MRLWRFFNPKYKSLIYLEPAYALFNLAQGIAELADVNLFLQKKCRYNTKSEPDLSTPCDDEEAGIEFVALVNSRYAFACTIFTVILTVLLSAWNDKDGGKRKFCILLPMALKLVQLIIMCLHSYFWHWPTVAAVFTVIFFHSAPCIRITSMIYICSVSATADRTFRLTLLHVLTTIAKIISNGSSGFLLRKFGFFYTYVLCTVLASVAVIHIGLLVKNTAAKRSQNVIMCIFDFIDVRYVIEAFKLVFRKRDGNERMIISLLSVINVLAWLTFTGEKTVLYLYLRYKFDWNEEDYGLYVLYKLFGICLGSLLCLLVRKVFKITDSSIGTFAAFWDVLAGLGYYYATENWHLYLIPLLDIFHGFSLIVCEAMRTHFFDSHEFGRLMSVHMTLQLGVAFTFPAYNLLFRKTMYIAPASIFLLSTAINFIVFVLYGVCNMLIKKLPTINEYADDSTQ